jgi:transcriptional regulator with XRE-family HTH domain
MPPNRIVELRKAMGLSARQVGLRVQEISGQQATERTVYRWERGETGIPDTQKLALADLFSVSVPWLMAWDEPNGNDGERERSAA